jgi:serine/threonine protein kinase
MTVVRRPARVTHSCPAPGSGDFWDGIAPSRSTILKSESARRVLEEHFQTIVQQSEDRRARFAQFQLELESKLLAPPERDALIRQFIDEESQISRIARSRLKIARFEKIKLIGRGGFGEVYLVRDKLTYELFALKVLSKADVIFRDQISNVRTERDILSTANNPWVVQLSASFQDSENLYLMLEYLPGGDMMTALIKLHSFPESTARFFAGEIALALRSIHGFNVLHRDLKPDNVLIGEDGHIKLTDFGLSTNYQKADNGLQGILDELQELMTEHYSPKRCQDGAPHARGHALGTCNYTAPEILRGSEPTTASDFWSLGVILYEMLFGYAPFNGKSDHETALRIHHFKKSLMFRKAGISAAAIDLIRHLLCEPETRYGFDEVVQHPWFVGFDFEHVELNPPPLVPVLSHPADTTHFDDILEERAPVPAMPQQDELAQAAFLGFTFKQRPRNMTLASLGIF